MAHGRRTRPLATTLELIAAAAITLWTVDFLVNLRILEELFQPEPLLVSWNNLLGMLQAELPVALVTAVTALLLAATLVRFGFASDVRAEAISLLAGAIGALTLASSALTAWQARASSTTTLLLALIAGAAIWLLLRRPMAARHAVRRRAVDTLPAVLLPSLIVGWTSLGLARARAGEGLHAAADLVGAILLVALGIGAMRIRSRWAAVVACAVPIGGALALALLAMAVSASYGAVVPRTINRPSVEARPDIVLIVLDTVRADHLARYGYARDTMPALERWAEGAWTAERAVAPAGWTTPAHVSIFSGRPVSLHGVHANPDSHTLSTPAVDDVDWLPSAVAREGYTSLAVTANPVAVPPDVEGFDRVFSPRRERWSLSTIAALFEAHSGLHNTLSERSRWRLPYSDAAEIVEITARVIEHAGDTPLFLFVNFLDAHSPYNPPRQAERELGLARRGAGSRELGHRELTLFWRSAPRDRLEELIDLYDAEMRWIDMQLEQLFSRIDATLGPDTVVIVTSDHGQELGESGRVGHTFGLAQSLLHVPLFVRSGALGTEASEELISLVGLHPFILGVARAEAPGESVLTDAGETGVVAERYASGINARLLGAQHARAWVAMYSNGWKGVGPSSDGFRLYDVSDSGFGNERAVEHDPVEMALRDRIDAYWEKYRDRRIDAERRETPAELEKLRSLGYVQ